MRLRHKHCKHIKLCCQLSVETKIKNKIERESERERKHNKHNKEIYGKGGCDIVAGIIKVFILFIFIFLHKGWQHKEDHNLLIYLSGKLI